MRSLGLLVLRIVSGGILVAHGYTKLFGGPGKSAPETLEKMFGPNFEPAVEQTGPEGFGEKLESMDVPAPKAAAYMSGFAEFGGGLALLLGFKTRLAAPIVIGNMATAIQKVHWKNGLYGEGGFEFPLLLAASAATLFLAGPGNLSLDALTSGHGKSDDDEKND